MSLDGYIAGPNDDVDNPGGDGFDRLHEWFGDFSRPDGPAGEMLDEMYDYGAIVAGRRTVEQVDHWGGDRDGVRIVVPSHHTPDAHPHLLPRPPLSCSTTVSVRQHRSSGLTLRHRLGAADTQRCSHDFEMRDCVRGRH